MAHHDETLLSDGRFQHTGFHIHAVACWMDWIFSCVLSFVPQLC
ncbi:MAG: hypothetical protein OXE44_11580 [Nitrospinae bacterium]|nr:hypothetical protein [Nitrospinota bacterium]